MLMRASISGTGNKSAIYIMLMSASVRDESALFIMLMLRPLRLCRSGCSRSGRSRKDNSRHHGAYHKHSHDDCQDTNCTSVLSYHHPLHPPLQKCNSTSFSCSLQQHIIYMSTYILKNITFKISLCLFKLCLIFAAYVFDCI